MVLRRELGWLPFKPIHLVGNMFAKINGKKEHETRLLTKLMEHASTGRTENSMKSRFQSETKVSGTFQSH